MARLVPNIRAQALDIMAQWLVKKVPGIENISQAQAIAMMIITNDYDPTQPVLNNKIGGVEFSIPPLTEMLIEE